MKFEKYFTLFFLLYTACISSYAYKPSMKSIEILENPLKAKTIYVGTLLKSNDEKLYFTGERGWTLFPINYSFGFPSEELMMFYDQIFPGKKYIFLSGDTVKMSNFYCTKLILIDSEEAKKLITTLADRQDFVGEINPSWQFCESDNECMQTKNKCGSLIGVNKKYEKNYLDFLKMNKLKLDCSKESVKSKMSESKCMENFCS